MAIRIEHHDKQDRYNPLFQTERKRSDQIIQKVTKACRDFPQPFQLPVHDQPGITKFVCRENISDYRFGLFDSQSMAEREQTLQTCAATAARDRFGGNFERCAVAYDLAKKAYPSQPLEVFYLENDEPYPTNCLFIVIGRDPASDPNDYTTWGPNTLICDPINEKTYPADQLEDRLLYRQTAGTIELTEYQLTTENNRQIIFINGNLYDPFTWKNAKIHDTLHKIYYSMNNCPYLPYLQETGRTDRIFRIFERAFNPSQDRLMQYCSHHLLANGNK